MIRVVRIGVGVVALSLSATRAADLPDIDPDVAERLDAAGLLVTTMEACTDRMRYIQLLRAGLRSAMDSRHAKELEAAKEGAWHLVLPPGGLGDEELRVTAEWQLHAKTWLSQCADLHPSVGATYRAELGWLNDRRRRHEEATNRHDGRSTSIRDQ